MTHGADHAEVWAQKARLKVQPLVLRIYELRRRVATTAVALLAVWLFIHVTFGANGMVVYRSKKAEYHKLQQEINGLQKENEDYTKQVTELKSDPKRIEKEAREQFHYARPGEVIYVAPERPAPPPPSNHSASK